MARIYRVWANSKEATQETALDTLKIERMRAVALASKRLREMLAAEYEASRKKEKPQE